MLPRVVQNEDLVDAPHRWILKLKSQLSHRNTVNVSVIQSEAHSAPGAAWAGRGHERSGTRHHQPQALRLRIVCAATLRSPQLSALTSTMALQASKDFDVSSLQKYFAKQLLWSFAIETPDVRKFSWGQSNPTYLVTSRDQRFCLVLRKKPDGKVIKTAHSIEREFEVCWLIGVDVEYFTCCR